MTEIRPTPDNPYYIFDRHMTAKEIFEFLMETRRESEERTTLSQDCRALEYDGPPVSI